MLARRLPGLLPPLTRAEAIAVTKIHSLAGERPPDGLVRERPFRSPHSATSFAGLVGGGSVPRPGEASLAHNGVLFLDELPEFRRDALEALRQPLEEGRVTVVRARARLEFPARFALLAAMNPCPCGHLGDTHRPCVCTPHRIHAYRGRISGPLLDRIDLHVDVPALSYAELSGPPGEASAAVARRVRTARDRQAARAKPAGAVANADLDAARLRATVSIEPDAIGMLAAAVDRLGLTGRAHDRLLKVALTIADLAGAARIGLAHLAEALQFRGVS
jgi:magnesium chelatase family protein